jgi:hypothetical protein
MLRVTFCGSCAPHLSTFRFTIDRGVPARAHTKALGFWDTSMTKVRHRDQWQPLPVRILHERRSEMRRHHPASGGHECVPVMCYWSVPSVTDSTQVVSTGSISSTQRRTSSTHRGRSTPLRSASWEDPSTKWTGRTPAAVRPALARRRRCVPHVRDVRRQSLGSFAKPSRCGPAGHVDADCHENLEVRSTCTHEFASW